MNRDNFYKFFFEGFKIGIIIGAGAAIVALFL